jgi:hypothetical protein
MTITQLLAEFEADRSAFDEALTLVLRVEHRLRYGRPYVTKDGQPLTTLEDVLHAVNNDQLAEEET